MGERNWDSDYLMRRFLGEHFGNAQDDQDRELDTLEGLQTPNLMDICLHQCRAKSNEHQVWVMCFGLKGPMRSTCSDR